MSISERTLRKWRKEALKEIKQIDSMQPATKSMLLRKEHCFRILQMTQILLDQHLLNKGK